MSTPLRHRRTLRPLLLVAALAIASTTAGAAASTAGANTSSTTATVCETEWGSLAKKRAPYTGKQITDVRAGRHQCFDRLVIDLNGAGPGRPGFHVKYAARVTRDGSGTTVRLRGRAQLRLIVKAPAYDDSGDPTYRPANRRELVDVAGYRTFRQVAWAGTHEGQTTIGLGVRARLPMRVFVLNDPDGGHRVIVDVAHEWS